MYDGSWNSDASRSHYGESGHGIGFNGRWEGDDCFADIIDSTGTVHRKVLTCRGSIGRIGGAKGTGGATSSDYDGTTVTSAFDMPPEMGYTRKVPYIHLIMEPHVG